METPTHSPEPPPGAPSRRIGLVLGILLVALAARVGYVGYAGLSQPPEAGSDQAEYDAYAWNLARGNGYRGPSPDVADPNHLTAYRPPVPSIVMAGVYATVGHRYDAVRLLHCVFGVVSVWLTYRLGRRAYGEGVGLLAAAGYALYPPAVLQSGDILSEPLGVMLFLAFLDRVLAFAETGGWRPAVAAGLLLGLTLLARASGVLMVPLFVVWAVVQFRRDRRSLVRAGAILAVAGLVMSPWVVRNYLVFGKIIPFSTMGGSVLLQGNNRLVVTEPKFFGYNVWDTDLEEYRDELRSAGDEYERDRRARAFAVRWLKDNPDKWWFLVRQKFVRSWTPILENHPSSAIRAVYLLTWGPVLVLFAAAVVPTLVASLRTRSPVWLLHVAVLHYVFNSVLFFAYIRYRAPVEPICFILAAWALHRLGARWQGGSAALPAGERGSNT